VSPDRDPQTTLTHVRKVLYEAPYELLPRDPSG
jgi:hypothetical protein